MGGFISVSADAFKVKVKPDEAQVVITGTTEGANIGIGAEVFSSRVDNTLQFRRISGDTVIQSGDTIFVTASDVDISSKVNVSGDTMTGDLSLPSLTIQTGATVTGTTTGTIHWNEIDGTTDRHLKHGVTLQDGQENIVPGIFIEDIIDGDVVSAYGFTSGGSVLIGKADTSLFTYTGNDLAVATTTGSADDFGYATIFGKVRGVNTSTWSGGTTLWLSNTVRGKLTDVEPVYPEQKIPICFVAKQHPTEGELLVNPSLDLSPQLNNLQYTDDYFIGTFVDKIIQNIFESGGTVYLTIEKDVVSGSTDFRVLVGTDDILTFSAQTIALIAGTDTVPVLNYISMIAGGIQTQTGWFTGDEKDLDGAFAAVATVLCQSPSGVSANAVYKHHAWIDKLLTDTRGDNVKVAERLRKENAKWENGVLPTYLLTPSGIDVDRIDISTTEGVIYQKNRNRMPIKTTVGDLDPIFTANNEITPYNAVEDLGELNYLSDGTMLSNNNRTSIVVFGVVSDHNGDSKLYANLSTGFYGDDQDAIDDSLNYSVYTVSEDFRGTAFLINRLVLKWNNANNGTWTIIDEIDLRGIEVGTSGGIIGGGGEIAVKQSLERDVDLIYHLVGDEDVPSPNYVYGVDSGSTRGWQDITSDNLILITGDTTLLDAWNGLIIEASGITGSTGYTITIPTGLTTGYNISVTNYLDVGEVTFVSNGTLLSRDAADKMVDQYGGAKIYHRENNTHVITGDVV